MFKVVNQATVASFQKPPANGNGYLAINPDPKPSPAGTYSVLVTGWSKPSKFSWDTVPNLLVIGTLFNADAGVRMLIENLTANPLIDRVYLLALTKFDLVSGSFKEAHKQLTELGYSTTVVFDNPKDIKPLPIKGVMSLPTVDPQAVSVPSAPSLSVGAKFSTQVHLGSDPSKVHASLLDSVMRYGTHCPERGFTYLTNQVSQLVGFPKPEYQEYFAQWESDTLPSEDVSYTYGSRAVPQLDALASGGDFSTQRVITLIKPEDYSKNHSGGMPCLTQLSYFNGELTAIFRSHDIGNAWLMNIQALSWLHYQWFPTLDTQQRILTILSINAHVYDWYTHTPGWVEDSLGYFYFKVSNNKYQAYLNDNLVYECGTKADLKRWVSTSYPNLSTSHAFWVFNAILTL